MHEQVHCQDQCSDVLPLIMGVERKVAHHYLCRVYVLIFQPDYNKTSVYGWSKYNGFSIYGFDSYQVGSLTDKRNGDDWTPGAPKPQQRVGSPVVTLLICN